MCVIFYAILQLFYPLAGLLADVHYGRYKCVVGSLWSFVGGSVVLYVVGFTVGYSPTYLKLGDHLWSYARIGYNAGCFCNTCAPDSGYLPSYSYMPAHMHAIRCSKQGCERADLTHMKNSKERVEGTDYVNSMHLILQLYHNLWRMRIYFILFEARDLSNQQAKKLISLLALSLAKPVKTRSQKQNLLPP